MFEMDVINENSGSVEWNGGMEQWNGIVEWNYGMTTPTIGAPRRPLPTIEAHDIAESEPFARQNQTSLKLQPE